VGEHRGPFGAEGVEEGVHGGGGAAGRGPCPCAAAPFRRTPVCQGPAGAVAALAVMGRRRSSLPVGISHADATALLGSCDRRRSDGRRDCSRAPARTRHVQPGPVEYTFAIGIGGYGRHEGDGTIHLSSLRCGLLPLFLAVSGVMACPDSAVESSSP